jgi:hypothetical protein
VDKHRPDATLELIDNALAGNTSGDAMRWTPDPDKTAATACRCALCTTPPETARRLMRESPTPTRRPVVESSRHGCQVVPFIGGPWHCDLRAMHLPLPPVWNVAPPIDVCALFDVPPDLLALPDPVRYRMVPVSGRLIGWDVSRRVEVYTVEGATQRELEEAMIVAYENRWDPPMPQ